MATSCGVHIVMAMATERTKKTKKISAAIAITMWTPQLVVMIPPFHCACRPSVNKSFFGNNDARYHHA